MNDAQYGHDDYSYVSVLYQKKKTLMRRAEKTLNLFIEKLLRAKKLMSAIKKMDQFKLYLMKIIYILEIGYQPRAPEETLASL